MKRNLACITVASLLLGTIPVSAVQGTDNNEMMIICAGEGTSVNDKYAVAENECMYGNNMRWPEILIDGEKNDVTKITLNEAVDISEGAIIEFDTWIIGAPHPTDKTITFFSDEGITPIIPEGSTVTVNGNNIEFNGENIGGAESGAHIIIKIEKKNDIYTAAVSAGGEIWSTDYIIDSGNELKLSQIQLASHSKGNNFRFTALDNLIINPQTVIEEYEEIQYSSEGVTELYVSPELYSAGDGSLENPLGGIEAVMKKIAEIAGNVEKIKVYFFGGNYYFDSTVEITDELLKNTSLELSAYNGEDVVFKGSELIKTDGWEEYTNNIFRTQIGTDLDFDVLFCNDEQQVMARYPNYKEDEILNGYSADCISPDRVKNWSHPETGYIRAIHSNEWGGNSYKITGKDSENNLTYEWVGDHNQGSGMHKTKRMVENIFEELDTENEWFYDRATGFLYFYPSAGTDLDSAVIEVASLDEIMRIVNCTSGVSIEGITFTQTHRTLFNSNYERPLRSDWGIVRKGCVYLENSENVNIEHCRFDHLGGNAVMMSGYNSNNTVDFCDFTNIGASGVLTVGLLDAVRDPSSWDKEDGTPGEWAGSTHTGNHKTEMNDTEIGPKTEDYPRDINISNNYVYNCGVFEKQTAGMYMSISRRITVTKNTIHHTPRSAITIGDGTFGGHIISDNDMFDTVRETGDHGPFNSWGRDRFWSLGGFVHDYQHGDLKRPYAQHDAIETTVIEHNRLYGTRGFGLDLDDGSTNYILRNNLCLGIGIKCREGFDRTVTNNIIVGAPLDIHCIYAYNNDIYKSNIVYNDRGVKYAGGADSRQTTKYENMIYWNMGNDVVSVPGTSGNMDPQFRAPMSNDYTVMNQELLEKTGFVNFPMSDVDFGRADAPKPPIFEYGFTSGEQQVYEFEGATLMTVTDSERSACAMPDYDGLYISDYTEESIFNQGDDLRNTVIRAINGQKIVGYGDLKDCYDAIEKGALMKMTIFSAGSEHDIYFRKSAGENSLYPAVISGYIKGKEDTLYTDHIIVDGNRDFTIYIANSSANDLSTNVIGALYSENGELIGLTNKSTDLTAGGYAVIDISAPGEMALTKRYEFKIMAWSEGQQPVALSETFTYTPIRIYTVISKGINQDSCVNQDVAHAVNERIASSGYLRWPSPAIDCQDFGEDNKTNQFGEDHYSYIVLNDAIDISNGASISWDVWYEGSSHPVYRSFTLVNKEGVEIIPEKNSPMFHRDNTKFNDLTADIKLGAGYESRKRAVLTFSANSDGSMNVDFALDGKSIGQSYIIGADINKEIERIQLYCPHDGANRVIVMDDLKIMQQY